jgi:hypothetical protein
MAIAPVVSDDLKKAYHALQNKQAPYNLLWRYYSGDQPLQYANRRMEQVFNKLDAKWNENWAAVVVDSVVDRMNITGFSIKDTSAKKILDAVWAGQNAGLDADRIHKAVAVCGEGYLIISQDVLNGTINMFANRPHLVHAFYSDDNPKEMEYAAKWWEVGDSTHLTIYYNDHFEYYTAKGHRNDFTDPGAFRLDPDIPVEDNPYGQIPVFHFCVDTERVLGELTNVIPLNNAINKLFADMMVAAEYGAFKQRYIVSNADTAHLMNGPNEIWEIPGGTSGEEATQIGQFEATDLANYSNAINDIAGKIAVITRTPKHYLLQTGNDVSGEALLAMEAPLIKKVAKYNQRAEITWAEVASFILRLSGHTVPKEEIKIIWSDERTLQPLMESQSHKTNVEAGMPLVTQLRREGWSDDQLELMQKDKDELKAEMTTMGDLVTEKVQSKFSQGTPAETAPYVQQAPAPMPIP